MTVNDTLKISATLGGNMSEKERRSVNGHYETVGSMVLYVIST